MWEIFIPNIEQLNHRYFFKTIQDSLNKISDSRIEISNCMTNSIYKKKEDDVSYLEEKHEKYKTLRNEEKQEFQESTSSKTMCSPSHSEL